MATPTQVPVTSTTTTSTTANATAGGSSRTAQAVAGITGYDAQAAALSPGGGLGNAISGASDTATAAVAGVNETTTGPRAVYTAYQAWILSRIAEVEALTGQAKLDLARGLLWQMEDTAIRCKSETVDVSALNKTPTAGAAQNCGGVPPEWIGGARTLIQMLENPIAGIEASMQGRVEGSKYADEDWNARLGVPQYRTQSDNLASPEATCNGTSAAMVFERIGVGRQAVVEACEREMGLTDASTVEAKTAKWTEKATAYLKKENEAGSNYQKPRGQSQSSTTRTTMAGAFKDSAQMEDMVLFLAWLKGIGRTSITSSSANLGTLLTSIDGTAGTNIATVEKITAKGTWETLSKKVSDTLNGGGAAVYSFYHKGSKASESGKTHIITVQQVLDDGFIVDDPYGKIRTDYSHNELGDAYGAKGSQTRTTKNLVHRTGDDWKVDQAQNPDADESKGDSVTVTKKTIMDSFYYVQLLKKTQPHTEEDSSAVQSGGAAVTPQ